MQIQDRLYQNITITEPVITELVNSKSIQRLKYVDQAGYFEPHFPNTKQDRFEHSIGCYYLLKLFGASLEEQVYGLIHDVSHSAFSHVVDYVLSEGSGARHDHQDNIFKSFVHKTNIPEILKKYNLNVDYILDEHNFPLQERDLPDLCADRIDYSLRGMIAYREIDRKQAQYFLDNLKVNENNNWYFANVESSKKYAEMFYKFNKTYLTAIQTALMFRNTGDYLKHGLSQNYINKDDLYTTDKEVLDKLSKHHNTDTQLIKLWKRVNNQVEHRLDRSNYEAKVVCKSRVVDPLVIHNKQIQRLSSIDKSWADIVKNNTEPKTYYIRFLD